ncbi:putative DNA metabolism protein [Gelidibacter algens]|uniref:Putative DNA metabolism protein n=1 Tax=Gelidibacter algens TaxID=49280 RepID=A0A1A7R311_9FLAO|nr:TIGR03915 family putative DNA repair protein [Gelidibacter algens]OBX25893.1 DNA metabolism protein [Gelidibacter algens]RAJ25314.1 putative DNA metabolism protein [Gelidibacter algens]
MLNSEEYTLSYDGTFDGFLTCVFHSYEQKMSNVTFQRNQHVQQSLFGSTIEIITDLEKADRVWKGIKSKTSARGSLRVYTAFLSEQAQIEALLLNYIQQAFISVLPMDFDFANETVLKVSQIAKSVGREKHRMEAFVRFKLTTDGIYFANIEPDFDVLPLISKHFKSRYADQKWIIYDLKRNYGLYYDLKRVEMMQLALPDDYDPTKTKTDFFTNSEIEFQTLWQDYFESTNIASRKNMKLHVQHVPKRYWKYLSEKLR